MTESTTPDGQSSSSDAFELIGSDYDQLWTSRIYDEFIIEALPSHPDFLLDLGCGAGTLTKKIAKQSHLVLGIDTSSHSIERAKTNPTPKNVQFMQTPIESIYTLLRPSSCNAIVAARSLHHCGDLRSVVRDLVELLTPDGVFVALELRATGRFAGGAFKRWITAVRYNYSILFHGLYSGTIAEAIKGLIAEKSLFASEAWREHIRLEPDFRWEALANALESSGLTVDVSHFNAKFCLLIGRKTKAEEI